MAGELRVPPLLDESGCLGICVRFGVDRFRGGRRMRRDDEDGPGVVVATGRMVLMGFGFATVSGGDKWMVGRSGLV